MAEMKNRIAERIRIQRLQRSLSQENMASALDLTIGAYSNIERGKTDITVARLYQIAEIFNLSIYDMLPESPLNLLSDPDSTQVLHREIAELKANMDMMRKEMNYIKHLVVNPEVPVEKPASEMVHVRRKRGRKPSKKI